MKIMKKLFNMDALLISANVGGWRSLPTLKFNKNFN